jgi:hypothetical protein
MKDAGENPGLGEAGPVSKTEIKEIAEHLADRFADVQAIWYVESDGQGEQHPNYGMGFAVMTSSETRENSCFRERLTADIQSVMQGAIANRGSG